MFYLCYEFIRSNTLLQVNTYIVNQFNNYFRNYPAIIIPRVIY